MLIIFVKLAVTLSVGGLVGMASTLNNPESRWFGRFEKLVRLGFIIIFSIGVFALWAYLPNSLGESK